MTGSRTPRARPRWLVPVLIVVVSLTVGGGLLARELYKLPDRNEDTEGVLPTTTSLPPEQQPGPSQVELTPGAAAHPENESVRQVLQTYVDAINQGNYAAWTTTVTRDRVQERTESQWRFQYRSTEDGSVLVHRVETVPDGSLRVLVGLTSTQDPVDAPADLPEPCIRWHLTLPMTVEGGSWKIDSVPAGSTPEYGKC
ncbi:hypothetical protein [Amycolatopsis cihanbeyliensis]|uniref:hypothetical protein n=1 Tax=Amycolatopsis cihanbeyliensis TaxID=1128664 RepID=UPI001FE70A05|nr:hypothetical protein [Amycolatopsis cihanbeyliensis]